MFKLRIALGILLAAPVVAAGGDNRELRSLRDADQADRNVELPVGGWGELAKRDKPRRDRVLEILKTGQLSTASDYFNAALVLQHGAAAEDIRLAHSLATIAATLDPKDMRARWLMAASWDRLLLRLNQPQWYGTQSTRDTSGKRVLLPIQANAVTDAQRMEFGVFPLAEIRARLEPPAGNK